MNKLFLSIVLILTCCQLSAQEKKLYHPDADAEKDIKVAIETAKKENKFVLIQAGGNWCKWCLEFARFATTDPQIDSVIRSSFVWYHLNFSKENKNEKIFEKLDYPQRFGFPVFIILNEDGVRIHTQNSEYLEDGKSSYDKRKVRSFLEMWTPHATNPQKYKN